MPEPSEGGEPLVHHCGLRAEAYSSLLEMVVGRIEMGRERGRRGPLAEA